jgi:hypothetical protein
MRTCFGMLHEPDLVNDPFLRRIGLLHLLYIPPAHPSLGLICGVVPWMTADGYIAPSGAVGIFNQTGEDAKLWIKVTPPHLITHPTMPNQIGS